MRRLTMEYFCFLNQGFHLLIERGSLVIGIRCHQELVHVVGPLIPDLIVILLPGHEHRIVINGVLYLILGGPLLIGFHGA